MDSFEEFLREVTPHNIQHQVSILKIQSLLWSEDTLVQIVNCIFEKVSAEPSDLIYLYVYTCKMMLEFEVKNIGSSTEETTVTFEDVMQSRAGFHLTEILKKQKKGEQMKSMAGKCAGNGLGAVCSFLSQLFVQDVLSSDTLLSCIHALMAHNTEITWQCLSKILKNSFVHLESLGMSHLFKRVFQRIYDKIQGKHFSVQTRFMLCDLNDLEEKNQETMEAQFHTFDKIRRQQPMSVNHQQALLYRMQPQAGQMNSMGNNRPSKERKIIPGPSASQEETLRRSENAWKPYSRKKKEREGKHDDEELLRRFKSILNKLTPQNFQKLMYQTMQLPINSEERLTGVTDLVFKKAIMEPVFSQVYANMCRVMQNIEVTKADGGTVQFRKLIIIKCQKQFERQRSNEKMEMEKKRIAALSEKEQEEALAKFEYQVMIAKKQFIGNIRFIGELFKLSLLREKIMQGCIFRLIKANDEESLECVSVLVSTVGHCLDHQKGKALMDHYFNQVDKIIKEKKVSSGIRFMLQDLKDLRESNWKPRRNKAKPVMIDQIRKEAEMEKQRREQEQLTARLAPRHWSNRRLGCMEKYQDDGWNTVAGNRSTKQNVIDNPAKLNITRQTIDDNVQLGPGDRPGSLGGWGKGSSGGGGKSSSGSSEAKISKGNRFMMLGEDELSRSMLPPSARDNKGRSFSASEQSREREIDRSRERQSAIADTQRFTGSLKSRSNELDRNQEKRVEPPAAVALSEEEYEKRSRSTIKEFVHLKYFKKVSFTEQPVERVSQSTPKEETRIGNFQRDLILQFQNESLTNDEVFDFIEKSIPPDVRKTKEFIRAVVSAMCFGAVKGEGTNSRGDHELLKKRSVLMQRYIDSDAKLELQALFAVQHLNYSLENPPGLLRLYFDVLYDEDVISEETFYSWKDSDDAAEKTGKGIALKSVTSFFTWLEESNPPNYW
ncbi:putative eukaryotic translation initiation factor 4 gamma 1 [Apostichopus japonicus]|uniref:Putative eukaryotic translation initiation factor 4 gamma 1 n=1 Tax=Stichopus japonicus TaxID=307972 RepID=A0A2G8KSW6_STIJA|nr:putative eukaryotic translation initiation factor 4 gamma 1 [Apostichopus japonicus]